MDNTISLAFQSMAELLGWTILHSIWQITLIALVLKLLLFWTAKQDATIRYALSISALVVATFWSGQTFIDTFNDIQVTEKSTINVLAESTKTSIVIATDQTVSPIAYLKELSQEAAQLLAPIMPYLAIFWFIGVLFFASRILVGFFRLNHLSNNGTQLLPRSWSTRLLTLQQLSGIHRPIKVRLSRLVESPITYQFFRPIILLPVSLFTHLSDEQIEVLLLHELAHIKRQDYLVNLLQSCIEVLFFYHPLIWWISKQIRLEREHCCDDRVMNLRHNPMLYAQTLTQIQGQHYSLKTKLAMSATGNTGDFSKRIYRLFQQKEANAMLRNSAAAFLLLLFSGAMMAFYPKHSAPMMKVEASVMVQDTVPKKLSKHSANTSEINDSNTNKKEPFNLKMKAGLLTLKTLKGKKPIVYVDNKVYHQWKVDDEGTLFVDIPNKEVNSINVFKEDKATAMFGPDASDGVVYINTKSNPHPEVLITEKREKLSLKSTDKKRLVIIDGKVSEQAVEDIDPDNIATITVKGEVALKQYGKVGKGDVVEIYTKGNESKESSATKTLKGKIEGNALTLQSDEDKKPLVVVDGKVSQQAVEDMDMDQIGTMSVLKGEAALKKYGEAGKNGVVEIYTKGNEPAEKQEKAEKVIKLNGAVGTPKSVDKKELVGTIDELNDVQPLFILDGKKLPKKGTSSKTMKDLDPDDIATISVVKGAEAIEKYGDEGVNGVVEIITKANKTALKIREKELKAKEKEMKVKQQKLNKKKKELKVKQKELKEKHKATKIKQKELKEKEKELKTNKAVLAGKAIQSPAAGLSVFPNPTRQLTNIQLNLEQKGNIKVDILNVNGQVVLNLVNDVLDKGLHQFQWNSDQQPAGSYFVHFNLDGTLMSKQVVVKK